MGVLWAKAFDSPYVIWHEAGIVDTTHAFIEGTHMPKEEWGVKRICPTTGKRFYDLNKTPIVSPYTGEVVEVDLTKSRMIAADAADAATTKAKQAEASEDEVVLDDDDSLDVDLGDDVLEDDDEDDDVSLEEIADVPADDDE